MTTIENLSGSLWKILNYPLPILASLKHGFSSLAVHSRNYTQIHIKSTGGIKKVGHCVSYTYMYQLLVNSKLKKKQEILQN